MAFSCRFFSGFFFFFASVDRLDRFSAFFFKWFRSRNVEWADFPCLFSSSVFPSSCTDIDWADFPRPFSPSGSKQDHSLDRFPALVLQGAVPSRRSRSKRNPFRSQPSMGEAFWSGLSKIHCPPLLYRGFFSETSFFEAKKILCPPFL